AISSGVPTAPLPRIHRGAPLPRWAMARIADATPCRDSVEGLAWRRGGQPTLRWGARPRRHAGREVPVRDGTSYTAARRTAGWKAASASMLLLVVPGRPGFHGRRPRARDHRARAGMGRRRR